MKNSELTTTDIGSFGERAAARFLRKKGYRILLTNYHAGKNEIDIIAAKRRDIVFVEVKTRTYSPLGDLPYGAPMEAVDTPKQKRTLAAASAYLYKSNSDRNPRFDIIEVYLKRQAGIFRTLAVDKICHIEDAFGS
jgi:putative endonuclease